MGVVPRFTNRERADLGSSEIFHLMVVSLVARTAPQLALLRPLVATRATVAPTASLVGAATSVLAPLAALPTTVRDPLSSVVLVIASVAWIKVCNLLSGSGLTSQYLSRKLVHMGSGPLFLLCWPIFSQTPSGQVCAALVPVLSIIRLLRAGSRKDGGQADLVQAVSRSGDKKEALGGPMVYTIVLLLSTLFGWRSLVSAVAVCQMAIGDGMADVIGRRYGQTRWPKFLEKTGKKSLEGSAAFAFFAFLSSLGFVGLFGATGLTTLTPAVVAPSLLLISLLAALVEVLPFGDDNFSVPLAAAALSAALLPRV